MKTLVVGSLIALCMASVGSFAAPGKNYVEGELLVQFKKHTDKQSNMIRMQASPSLQVKRGYPGLSKKLGRTVQLVADSSKTTAELIAIFENDPDVETVSPNYLKQFSRLDPTPNDTSFPLQWALHNTGQTVNGLSGIADSDIDFPEARSLMMATSPQVVVAVIDSGVDYTHPDLSGIMWTNPGEIAGNGIDDDLNGFVDDVYGYDFGGDEYIDAATGSLTNDGPDSDPMDIFEHGTHCAGIVGAIADNTLGVCGSGTVKVMAVKAGHNERYLTDSAVIASMEYVLLMKQRGVNIVAVNESFGGDPHNPIEENVLRLLGEEGIIVCAAAGNDSADGDSSPHYPSGYNLDNIISVASTDSTDQLSGFSNWGATSVDLGSPGGNILSARPIHFDTVAMVVKGAQTYTGAGYLYSSTTSSSGIEGTLYDCGLGYPADFPGAVAGNIALVERGETYYYEKVSNAMDAGASAIIIYNKEGVTGITEGTLYKPMDWIPSIAISRDDGLLLKSLAGQAVTVINRYNDGTGYQYLSGTSMASPLVAGCIGTLAQHFPGDSVNERVSRLLNNVDAIPALQGKCVTGGRLNLAKCLDSDQNLTPDCLESIYITDVSSSSGNNIAFRWHSFDEVRYRVLGSTSLRTPDYQPVSGEMSATPPENIWSTTTDTSGAHFFKVEQIWE